MQGVCRCSRPNLTTREWHCQLLNFRHSSHPFQTGLIGIHCEYGTPVNRVLISSAAVDRLAVLGGKTVVDS